ncbi:MAG: rRNA maturation RNase YbeY [Pseudomonadota bacterium]
MSATIELVNASGARGLPLRKQFKQWADAAVTAVPGAPARSKVSIRIVDAVEGASLNKQYRHKDYATNVLSFPVPAELIATGELGDIALCAPVVQSEAEQQQKDPVDHWAHLVVHGVLHLLGYDHENNKDAKVMEGLETTILAGLGIRDPYQ